MPSVCLSLLQLVAQAAKSADEHNEIIYKEAMEMFEEIDTDGSGWISSTEVGA
eukprot:SAG22_NODE_302_length_12743_cov_12.397738_13_plen_53_part_00